LILPNESPDVVSVSGMILIASSLLILNFTFRKKKKTLERAEGELGL
jgi:hypothetical protein